MKPLYLGQMTSRLLTRFALWLIAGATAAVAYAQPCHAENWYLLSDQNRTISFSVERSGARGAWFRQVEAHEADSNLPAYAEEHSHFSFHCAERQYAVTERRLFDTQGNLIRDLRLPSSAAAEWRAIGDRGVDRFLLDVACSDVALVETPPDFVDPAMTTIDLGNAFRSGDARVRSVALAKVLAQPGAFPPLAFSRVARALADDGRVPEALRWYEFGRIRLLVDLRATFGDNPPSAAAETYVLDSLPTSVSEFAARMSPEQGAALLREVLSLDAATPRYYPVDWGNLQHFGLDVAWGSVNRPGWDLAQRQRLDEARRNIEQRVLAAPHQ